MDKSILEGLDYYRVVRKPIQFIKILIEAYDHVSMLVDI